MKRDEKEKAITLRKQGLSVNKIAKEVGVSKSTVSLWVKSVKISDKQKKQLRKRTFLVSSRKKGQFSKKRLEMGEEKWTEHCTQRKRKNTFNWRKNNPEKYVNRDVELKIRLLEERGGECLKCNYNKSLGALDFHHRDPNKKEFGIGQIHRSYNKMKKEADKCDVLCSNCHRELHWKEGAKKRKDRIDKIKNARLV